MRITLFTNGSTFLMRLKLKSMIHLTPDNPEEYLVEFCKKNAIEEFYIKVGKFKESVTLTYPKVVQVLQVCTTKVFVNI